MCSENLSAMNNTTAPPYQEKFTFELAASYGNLTSDAKKRMDDDLKVMISVTNRSINKLTDLSWDNVLDCMRQNPTLVQMQEPFIVRSKDFPINTINWFKVDGSPDEDVVERVRGWFCELIGDDDILKENTENIKTMANIVAETGTRVTNAFNWLVKSESEKRGIIDVGILRYPDIESPYFKVYRIHLVACRESRPTRFLIVQQDNDVIRGEFNCMQFKPRDDVIAKLSPKITAMAIADAEALFQ